MERIRRSFDDKHLLLVCVNLAFLETERCALRFVGELCVAKWIPIGFCFTKFKMDLDFL